MIRVCLKSIMCGIMLPSPTLQTREGPMSDCRKTTYASLLHPRRCLDDVKVATLLSTFLNFLFKMSSLVMVKGTVVDRLPINCMIFGVNGHLCSNFFHFFCSFLTFFNVIFAFF